MSGFRKRVVLLVGGLDPGGTERQLERFLERADHRRFAFTVIALNDRQRQRAAAVEQTGAAVLFVPRACHGRWRRLLYLRRELRRLRADVVHAWSFYANLYAGVAGRLAGVPRRLGSLRGSLEAPSARSLPAPLRWLCLATVERVVVNARAIETELRQRGWQHGLYVPNVLDLDRLQNKRPVGDEALRRIGLEPPRLLIGAVGHLRRVKNHALLIASLARVLPERPGAGAVIVGGESDEEPGVRAELLAQIAAAGLERRVALAGYQADIAGWLRRFDVLCHPSDREATPNAVLEAMACGVPVIATRVGELPRLLEGSEDEEAGVLLPPGDLEALVTALRRMLDDPVWAKRLGEAGARRAAGAYTGEGAVRRLETLYHGDDPRDGE